MQANTITKKSFLVRYRTWLILGGIFLLMPPLSLFFQFTQDMNFCGTWCPRMFFSWRKGMTGAEFLDGLCKKLPRSCACIRGRDKHVLSRQVLVQSSLSHWREHGGGKQVRAGLPEDQFLRYSVLIGQIRIFLRLSDCPGCRARQSMLQLLQFRGHSKTVRRRIFTGGYVVLLQHCGIDKPRTGCRARLPRKRRQGVLQFPLPYRRA